MLHASPSRQQLVLVAVKARQLALPAQRVMSRLPSERRRVTAERRLLEMTPTEGGGAQTGALRPPGADAADLHKLERCASMQRMLACHLVQLPL